MVRPLRNVSGCKAPTRRRIFVAASTTSYRNNPSSSSLLLTSSLRVSGNSYCVWNNDNNHSRKYISSLVSTNKVSTNNNDVGSSQNYHRLADLRQWNYYSTVFKYYGRTYSSWTTLEEQHQQQQPVLALAYDYWDDDDDDVVNGENDSRDSAPTTAISMNHQCYNHNPNDLSSYQSISAMNNNNNDNNNNTTSYPPPSVPTPSHNNNEIQSRGTGGNIVGSGSSGSGPGNNGAGGGRHQCPKVRKEEIPFTNC